MKILWLTNVPLPEVSRLMADRPSPFGGWLINASIYLAAHDNVTLSIAFPKQKLKDIWQLNGEKIKYFAFPQKKREGSALVRIQKFLTTILQKVQPDVVHIFGTEYVHSLAMVNACKERGIKTVITIQGLVSFIEKHYLANLPLAVLKSFTFRDFIKQNNILQQQKDFKRRGKMEIEAIRKTEHVIGRTTWDKACVSQINPKATYHFCNEILREKFYEQQWSLENCERHAIFLSQASYPIKGLHYMLQAMGLILQRYPKAKLYIAGPDITSARNIKEKLKRTSYASYIKRLIKELNLERHVFFMGLLDEKQMCERFLKAHVFICPSSIENSPNSLGEAMILGVPCVASHVGGIPDMLTHKEEGFLYQADAPYMLAYFICEIFGSEELVGNFSYNSRKRALQTHDKIQNQKKLLDIYKQVIGAHSC